MEPQFQREMKTNQRQCLVDKFNLMHKPIIFSLNNDYRMLGPFQQLNVTVIPLVNPKWYRVTHLQANLRWGDFDYDCSTQKKLNWEKGNQQPLHSREDVAA